MIPNRILVYHIIQGSMSNHGTRFSPHCNLTMGRDKVLQHLLRSHILSKQWYYIISCCGLLLFETTLHNLVCGYHNVQGSTNKPWHQLLISFIPSYSHIRGVRNTSTATICCITNNTISFHADFSYFLSVCSPIPFPVHGNHNVQDSINNHGTKLPPHYNLPIGILK